MTITYQFLDAEKTTVLRIDSDVDVRWCIPWDEAKRQPLDMDTTAGKQWEKDSKPYPSDAVDPIPPLVK